MTKLKTKTDTQETKKKVLGGNTSGNLLNLVFWAERKSEEECEKKLGGDDKGVEEWGGCTVNNTAVELFDILW